MQLPRALIRLFPWLIWTLWEPDLSSHQVLNMTQIYRVLSIFQDVFTSLQGTKNLSQNWKIKLVQQQQQKQLTHWRRPWCWERWKAKGEEGSRGWDSWIASSTQWTWTWANSRRQWGTGKPDMLQSMGSQRAGHSDWRTTTKMVCFTLYYLRRRAYPSPHILAASPTVHT